MRYAIKMSVLLIVCIVLPQAYSLATYVNLTDKRIAEEIAVGSLVADLSQESALASHDSHFTFLDDIKTSVENTYFLLDAVTGRLTSKRFLDRESMCQNKHCSNKCRPDGTCVIDVKVLLIPNYTIYQFKVQIEDINDNKPHFASDYQLRKIAEDASVGHRIAVEHAFDPDFGPNSVHSYRLVDKHVPFELVLDQSLYLKVSDRLDRESVPDYNLSVEACDAGKPVHCARTLVHIVLIDVNDNKPRFERASYQFSVPENELESAVIGHVKALDLDHGCNSIIKYSLINNPGAYFRLNHTTGELSVRKWFDYEKEKHFSLSIEARDSGPRSLQAYANVDVCVQDLNDNEPLISVSFLDEFHRNETNGHVTVYMVENLPAHKFIAHVQVKDKDEVSSGKLEWNVFVDMTELRLPSIRPVHANHFTINKLNSDSFSLDTGSRPLDRETTPTLNISIRATDQKHTVFYNFSIVLLDENDNAPSLDKLHYDLNINENNYVDQLIHKFEARDPDHGQNAMLAYSVDSSLDFVYIEPLTGYLRASKVFDREQQSVYEFYVVVRDNPANFSLSRSGRAKCRLNIIDLNDNEPVIVHNSKAVKSISVRVEENVDLNSRIAKLTCLDTDSSSKVAFYLKSGDSAAIAPHLPFRIDSDGSLVNSHHLDREAHSLYHLQAVCSDGKFNTSLNVTVYIGDLNDNCPRNLYHTDSVKLVRMLNVSSGRTLFTEFYMDDDTGPNAQLSFRLDNQQDKFAISVRPMQHNVYQMNLSVLNSSLFSAAGEKHGVRVRVSDMGDTRCQIVEHFVVFIGDEQAFNESMLVESIDFMPLMKGPGVVFYVLLVGFFVAMGSFLLVLIVGFVCRKNRVQKKPKQTDGLRVRNYRLMEAVKLDASNRLSLSTDHSGESVSSDTTKETTSPSPSSSISTQQQQQHIAFFHLSSFQKTNVVRVSDYSSDASECNESSDAENQKRLVYNDGPTVCREEQVPCLIDIHRTNSYGHYIRSSIV